MDEIGSTTSATTFEIVWLAIFVYFISRGNFSVAPVARRCSSLRLILAPIFNKKSNPSSMSLLIGATCTTAGNVTVPYFINNGPTIRPTIFISLSAVCNDVTFRHGGLGFIPLYISSEMTVTMAAVSTTAFIDLSWSVMVIIKGDGGEIW